MMWALSVAYIGVFFAVPLRKYLIVVEKLKFPSGTATYETIIAMIPQDNSTPGAATSPASPSFSSKQSASSIVEEEYDEEHSSPDSLHIRQQGMERKDKTTGLTDAKQQARALLLSGCVAALFTLSTYFVPQIETPPLWKHIGLALVADYGWNLSLDPLLVGGGMLAGAKVSV